MIRYIIRRVLWAILVLLIVVFLTFVIFFLLPTGDPAVRLAGKARTPEILAQIREHYGLDHPWYVQYLLFLKRAVLGDQYGWPGLGQSFTTKVPLKETIFSRIAVTAQLALGAAFVWIVIGLSIGILAALRPRTLGDRTAMGLAVLAISMPVFFLGPLALYIFWFKLEWLPGTGYYPLGEYGFGEWFGHWILPWVVLSVLYAAFYARLTRSNLMETMAEDYIRTARAKGLSETRVVLKHGLRAGLTPIVTVFDTRTLSSDCDDIRREPGGSSSTRWLPCVSDSCADAAYGLPVKYCRLAAITTPVLGTSTLPMTRNMCGRSFSSRPRALMRLFGSCPNVS